MSERKIKAGAQRYSCDTNPFQEAARAFAVADGIKNPDAIYEGRPAWRQYEDGIRAAIAAYEAAAGTGAGTKQG